MHTSRWLAVIAFALLLCACGSLPAGGGQTPSATDQATPTAPASPSPSASAKADPLRDSDPSTGQGIDERRPPD